MSFRSFFIEQWSHTETNFSSPITFGDPEFSTNKMLPRLKGPFPSKKHHNWSVCFRRPWLRRPPKPWKMEICPKPWRRWPRYATGWVEDRRTRYLLVGSLQNLDGGKNGRGIYPMPEHFQDLGMISRKISPDDWMSEICQFGWIVQRSCRTHPWVQWHAMTVRLSGFLLIFARGILANL